MGLDRSLDQRHALGDGTHLLFPESVELVERPPRTTPNKTYEDATHRLEVNALVAIENEDFVDRGTHRELSQTRFSLCHQDCRDFFRSPGACYA